MSRKLSLKQKKNGFLIKKACHYMEQDSTKNRVVLVKMMVFLNTRCLCKKCYSQDKYKSSSKKHSFFILIMPTKNESID